MEQQTAVELLHKESNELITQYLDGKIDKRELITMHHNILYPHKAIEKEQIIKTYNNAISKMDYFIQPESAEQYYNETYNK